MKGLLLFFICILVGFFDFFYMFILFFFCIFFVAFDMGAFYFGGIFFCDSFSFLLIILSVLVFLFCVYTCSSDFWTGNFFLSFSLFLSLIFFCLYFCFFVFSMFFFYIFFEAIFFLMFVFLLTWGYSPERLQASLFMIFYTIVVSFPFLVFLVFSSFDCFFFKFLFCFSLSSYWWFFIFFVFLVKLPVYGVHLWLPKAHVEAPVTGSMVLAGVLLKLGGYGIFRFSFFFLKYLSLNFGLIFSLGLLGGLYSCFLCLRQCDLKSFVAYSSVCHMSYALAGFYSFSFAGVFGGVLMLISHGFCSSCLFYLLYVLYERFYSRSLLLVKGILFLFSFFTFWIFVFSVLNMGVPPSLSFFSEVSISVSLLSVDFFSILLASFLLFFSGVYSIFFYTILGHGFGVSEGTLFSVGLREILNMFCHLFFLFFICFYLNFFLFF